MNASHLFSIRKDFKLSFDKHVFYDVKTIEVVQKQGHIISYG